MRTTLGQDVAGIVAGLDHRVVHVWLLDYRKAQKRAPLCALLGAYLGLPADAVVLVEGEHGRPELASPWNQLLQFNWSHSGDKAIIAVARGLAPGIDIEHLRPRPRAMQLAERFFHPDEVADLATLPADARERAFMQLWTGKEAVLKALGRGVAFGLHRLRLTVAPQTPALLWLENDDISQWRLHPLDIDADHAATLAWRGPPRTIDIRTLADSG
ncbi:4'-phosphopantetheinyl transferase family protein [Dyella acidiphila]|uniref:4'-phosphopantetheinyl transferase superfamily protein n=1 Tax=Dyella acidiphila TaxID=2775866 RepID=A0ABR9GDI8_9GAMM|nr:4'-phosphopantetheinyl transferase superfamily protein [Dyella acidiphila]MBE1162120.1 4'-phosphopantetheinyl transferase superfamily protein [Dyella acidiphila]